MSKELQIIISSIQAIK